MVEKNDIEIDKELPLLAVRDVVIFNDMILPLYIGRDKSLAALEAAQSGAKQLLVVAQMDQSSEFPIPEEIYRVGTVAQIVRQLKMPDGRLKILVQGLAKARIVDYVQTEPFLKATLEILEEEPVANADSIELEALMRNVRDQSQKILLLRDLLSDEIVNLLEGIEEPGRLANLVVSNIKVKVDEAQKVLETTDPMARLQLVNSILAQEVKVSAMQAKLDSEAREEMDKSQKEFFLREQLRLIKRELGKDFDRDDEAREYRVKFQKAHLPKDVAAEAIKQLSRLEYMHQDAAEASIIRSYLDWIVELPWGVTTRDHLDLAQAKKILDADHYNLKKVKDRILEYLAVMKLSHRQKGPIICFVGPPGVGKTSLGQSIAKAMGRKFVRLSLGGMKDEAEIRGHRRTYIGALPGRIIQGLKAAGSSNPVFMLDEVDKIGNDFRGDPASALLEVLDPEQNSSFSDHYLNLPFDLSRVMFITTANFLDPIPQALEDRMEIIHLSGYTAEEKVSISKKHLLPRLIKDHGLKHGTLTIQDSAIKAIISSYTYEAGLRGLDRKLAAICRKVARKVAEGRDKTFRITEKQLHKLLGPPEIVHEPKLTDGQPGVATGLAWTEGGGEVMYVEVRTMPGKGNLSLTGQLDEVMKESAQTVLAYARAHAMELGLDKDFYEEMDIHVHVPEGSVPKEGPSAGVALMVALISALTGIPVPKDMAMTGEITLRGQILAIGGLKEKSLAALRRGVKRIIIPRQNLKDLEDVAEIPANIKRKLAFLPVDNINDLLDLVFPNRKTTMPISPKRPEKKDSRFKEGPPPRRIKRFPKHSPSARKIVFP
ncbi:MAG: endopeptidase La [Deltaproteobacteria bacterium]|jgi:ATP-dependent Lon protease|nr:endopeptidase La [Deltaproteobacteria bacterium]